MGTDGYDNEMTEIMTDVTDINNPDMRQ